MSRIPLASQTLKQYIGYGFLSYFVTFRLLCVIIQDIYIIPTFDEREYARKLDLLMNDEDLRMRMATKGRESTKRFDPKVIAQQWIELFQSL